MTGLPHEIRRFSPWTSEDTRNALLTSLIPAGAGWCILAKDKDYSSFAPDWIPRDVTFYRTMDLLTMAPLGYATYLVYKYGGGFDHRDTTIALGLYGGMALLDLTTGPVVDSRNYKSICVHCGTKFFVTASTAYAYYHIYKEAGYWMIPITLWSALKAAISYSLHQNNTMKIA
ncbi:Protein C41G7.9 a [Aphelenchoides avenae]|nr:Protein C41G7.9 a [Aphelenchus avenae]